MPIVSRFLGIVVMIYHLDHGIPHFHIRYGDYRAVFSILDLKLMQGTLPKRVTSLVVEWAFEHRAELIENWDCAQTGQPLKPIPPLT